MNSVFDRLPRVREPSSGEAAALITEVERLRAEVAAERAAVVAWLREEAEAAAQTFTLQAGEWANRIGGLANSIESGEHRREEER